MMPGTPASRRTRSAARSTLSEFVFGGSRLVLRDERRLAPPPRAQTLQRRLLPGGARRGDVWGVRVV